MLALEAGELETLTPIRLRYTGPLQDLTTARDDQDVLHTEVQEVEDKIINTTVGRVIFNTALPKGMPFVNGMLKKKGLQQLVQRCYLNSGPGDDGRDAGRAEADGLHLCHALRHVDRHRGPDHPAEQAGPGAARRATR